MAGNNEPGLRTHQLPDVLEISTKQTQALGYLMDNTTEELLYGGAAGGGKTVLGCVWSVFMCATYPGVRGFIGRYSQKDLYATVILTFHWVCKQLGYVQGYHYNINENKGEIKFANGSMIFLRDLRYNPKDEYFDRLKLELTFAWIEEGTQIPEEAKKALKPRIRYRLAELGMVRKLLITSNPGEGWLKKEFVMLEDGTPVDLPKTKVFLQALVKDNPDKGFAKQYAKDLADDSPANVARYLHGRWDINVNENMFFWAFDRNRHFTNMEYKFFPRMETVISFDFNKDPCACVVGQHLYLNNNLSWNISHVFTATPKTRPGISPLIAVCEQIQEELLDPGHVDKWNLIVTGDASGSAGGADKAEGEDNYRDICDFFEISYDQVMKPRKNEGHKMSQKRCNKTLQKIPPGRMLFWGNALAAVMQIENAKPNHKGSLLKDRDKNKNDIVDAYRYLIRYWFPERDVNAAIEILLQRIRSYEARQDKVA